MMERVCGGYDMYNKGNDGKFALVRMQKTSRGFSLKSQ